MNYHSDAILQKWSELTLAEQLGNVGSEVSRMIKWHKRDPNIAERAFERMLELLSATISCRTGTHRLKELTRLRELIISNWYNRQLADDASWDGFNKYFMQFAILANKAK